MSYNVSDKIDLAMVPPGKALAMGGSNMDYKPVEQNISRAGKITGNPAGMVHGKGPSSTYRKGY